MSQDVTWLGNNYTSVPFVTLPKTGGGTALFSDPSGVTATAADVASGKYFLDQNGELKQGTASGGGGSGLVYESGTYTPTTDTAQPTISFSNSHSNKPFFVLICDATGTAQSTNNSELYFAYIDFYTLFGTTVKVGSNTYYARRQGGYKGTGGSLSSTGGNDTSNSTTYVSSSSFKPSNGTSYYWRSGRTYKWIAVWKP